MAIFDILEQVSEKSAGKTEGGENRIYGVVIGEVISNYDDGFPGRVCVKIHTRGEDEIGLKWARVAMQSSGSEWGHYFLPEVGDQVLVVFEEGIIDRPYIIGCISKTSDKFLSKSKHEKNQHKRIVTKHGSSIEFEDVADDNDDGTKDKIRIYTPEEAHSITLDNDKKLIEIMDKDKNAQIQMKTEKGEVLVKAAKKLTVKVGDNITIVLNGESGKVTVNCQDFTMDATGKTLISATGKMALSGAQFTAEAQGMAKVTSNGIVQISGTPIKIG